MTRALVTGGGRGIGAAVCDRLARDGFSVAVADIDASAASEIAARLPGAGHAGYAVDVSDEQSVAQLFENIERDGDLIAVLVCCAGVLILPDGTRPKIWETTLADWDRTQAVNLRGTFLTIREYLRRRIAAPVRDGRIVTFGSVAAQLGGYRSSSAYIATKAGVLGLTKAVAREAAPLGITVNAVAPGLIDAPMLRQSLDPSDDETAAAAIPLGRIGKPEDVAAAVSYLVSRDASYVTGATIDVNGGYRMQ
ncbi:MAG TPA: SDR family NAD(P)-dependent oxidoreductase [Alphaproteobacteria bacterium]